MQAVRRNTRKHLQGEKTTMTDDKINRLREVRLLQANTPRKLLLLTLLQTEDWLRI